MVEEAAPDVGAHHPKGCGVDLLLGDLTRGEGGVQQGRREESWTVQFLVETVDQTGRGGMHSAEVRHDIPVEPEVGLEDLVEHRVLAGVDTVDLVVRAHHAFG